MTSIVLYFQVHQPFRLRPYSFYNIGQNHLYEAASLNFEILNRIVDKCYLPANETILNMIEADKGFKCAFSLSGTVLEQLEMYRPDVIASFKKLAATGQVEFLAETYFHSLAGLYSKDEFERQVLKYKQKIKKLLDVEPVTFRNTELIYDDSIAEQIVSLGFKYAVAEGVDRYLDGRPSSKCYKSPGRNALKLILRNSTFSDDIAFRFTNQEWSGYPLTADKFADWVNTFSSVEKSEAIGLFMDYETFGEHRPAETGIFEFLRYLPTAVANYPELQFAMPREVLGATKTKEVYTVEEPTSWADEARDISGWTLSYMQKDALKRIYALEDVVMKSGNEPLIHQWGKLQTSDHFYYMSTKYWGDGVREVFSPYKSPFDAYINYMNVLADFEQTLR